MEPFTIFMIFKLVCHGWKQIAGFDGSMYLQKKSQVCRISLPDGKLKFYKIFPWQHLAQDVLYQKGRARSA